MPNWKKKTTKKTVLTEGKLFLLSLEIWLLKQKGMVYKWERTLIILRQKSKYCKCSIPISNFAMEYQRKFEIENVGDIEKVFST